MGKQFFITATGTDIGKSFILEKLCRAVKDPQALKPIISGFDPLDSNNDCARILKFLNRPFNQENLDAISPWRYKAPLSPNIAAELEKRPVDFLAVVDFCQKKINQSKKNDQYLFIEGAGGVMTPITNQETYCDLMAALNIPAILVSGNYLGTISHTLSAIKALEFYKIKIAKIILNCRDSSGFEDNLKSIKSFTGIEVVVERFQE